MSKNRRENTAPNHNKYLASMYRLPTEQIMTLPDEIWQEWEIPAETPQRMVHRSLTAFFNGMGLIVDSNAL